MDRQSTVLTIIGIIAVVLVVGLVATRNTASRNHSTLPGVAPADQNSTGANPANSGAGNPCPPNDAATSQPDSGPGSTGHTATTTQGTTSDGRPTGAFVGQPCTPGSSDTQPVGTAGSGTTSMRNQGTSGSGSTHGAESGR